MPPPLFERFLSTAAILDVFEGAAFVQAMLDVEAALARAEAAEGVIPTGASASIEAACVVEGIDLDALAEAGARAGSLAIPLVKQLTERVRATDAAAAGWVHWGGTSQDVIDTAMAICSVRALALVDEALRRVVDGVLDLAERHLETPALARTLLQPAQAVSFGFKLVAWAGPLVRGRARLRRAAGAALNLQLGGAVGTLSTMGGAGPAVARRMAADLGLGVAPGPWHTQRDVWVALGCELGLLCGSLGKIGTDIALLSQGEVGEVAEPSGSGRGGSSAMPHKRNPVAAMVARASALRAPQRVAALLAAMGQEQERGLGGWQAELAEWPGLWISTHGSASALAEALSGLEVDGARMRANIEALQGLAFAEALSTLLARELGKAAAHEAVERLSKRVLAEKRSLAELALEAAAQDPAWRDRVSKEEIGAIFDVAAAARLAASVARPQLAALRAEHERTDTIAPAKPGTTSA